MTHRCVRSRPHGFGDLVRSAVEYTTSFFLTVNTASHCYEYRYWTRRNQFTRIPISNSDGVRTRALTKSLTSAGITNAHGRNEKASRLWKATAATTATSSSCAQPSLCPPSSHTKRFHASIDHDLRSLSTHPAYKHCIVVTLPPSAQCRRASSGTTNRTCPSSLSGPKASTSARKASYSA